MRLTSEEIEGIKKAFKEIKSENKIGGKIYLFGSRTQSKKRGGDIDLLWLGPESDLEKMRAAKFDLIAKIQKYLEPQRIDLTSISDEKKNQDPFYQTIQSDLVEL